MLIIKNSNNQKCSFGSLENIAREHAQELNTRTREYTARERKVTSELYHTNILQSGVILIQF